MGTSLELNPLKAMLGVLAKRIGTIVCILGMLGLGGCPTKKQEAPIVLLVIKDSPPYSFKSEDSDSPSGFEVEVLKEVARRLGKELVTKTAQLPAIFSSLGSLSADCAVIGTPLAQARKTHFALSTPYASSKLTLIARKDRNMSSISSLFSKTLAVLSGSAAEDAANSLSSKVFGLAIKPLQSNEAILDQLLADEVDAVILEDLQAKHFACEHQGSISVVCHVPEEMYSNNSLCILFPKESVLKEKVDKILEEMRADSKMEELKRTWLPEPVKPQN